MRAATRSAGLRASNPMSSSETPSLKYLFFGSPPRLSKGSTATERGGGGPASAWAGGASGAAADQCSASSPSDSTATSAINPRKTASRPLSGGATLPSGRSRFSIQPPIRASGKPTTLATISQRSAQGGASKAGSAIDAACTRSQPPTA